MAIFHSNKIKENSFKRYTIKKYVILLYQGKIYFEIYMICGIPHDHILYKLNCKKIILPGDS